MTKYYTIAGIKNNEETSELEEFTIINIAEEMTEVMSHLIFNEGSVVRTITLQSDGFIKE